MRARTKVMATPPHPLAPTASTSDGETLWKEQRDEPTNWSTPLIVEHQGKKQIVLNGQNKARSYDLESGEELWSCGGQTDRPCASAVAADGLVYVGAQTGKPHYSASRVPGLHFLKKRRWEDPRRARSRVN